MSSGKSMKPARVIINNLLTFSYSATETDCHKCIHKSVLRLSSLKASNQDGPPPYPLPTRMYVPLYATVLQTGTRPFFDIAEKIEIIDGSKYAAKNFPRYIPLSEGTSWVIRKGYTSTLRYHLSTNS